MIVTFCGHSNLINENEKELENKIINILTNELNQDNVDFYLGGYGQFDNLAKRCCDKYKQLVFKSDSSNKNVSKKIRVIFITPYIDEKWLKNNQEMINQYDEVIYPNLEKTPKKYAILKRNYWMMKNSDLIISYVKYPWGGASKTLEYAQHINKKIINLFDFIE